VSSASDGAEFRVGAATITWTSDVVCSKTVTVTGAGKGVTILDAGSARRFFSLQSGCALTLKYLSLRNGKPLGRPYGGAINVGGGINVGDPPGQSSLDATGVEFKDGEGLYGGAVYVTGGSSASFTSCDFKSNFANCVVLIDYFATATFAPTLPVNYFFNNSHSNCCKDDSATLIGSC
jgi:hypothetical protein